MLSSPVGVVTDLDGTVVFGGVADPRLAPFLRRAAGCEDISVIVATSRAPRGMVEVLGDAVTCLEGSVCLNGALLRLGDKERRYPMRADHVRAVVDAAFRAGMPLYVDRGHSFTALAGHDPVAEPWSGAVSAAVSDVAASPGTAAEKETRRRGGQDSETATGLWDGLEHMRDYPDGKWYTDPAQVPTEDVLKVTVVSRRYQGRAGQDIIRQRIADPLQGAADPGTRAAGAQETGGPEPAGALQDLLGLRLDGVVAYPHEDGVVDVCAAGVDKSVCMRLPTGEEELAASGGADTSERTAVMGQTPGLRHRPVSTWVAVGNDANDVAMIRAADIGVIVGDGLEEVRARRRTVRVPSRPGAVVSILEQLLELHH